jgi:hypothetical protein
VVVGLSLEAVLDVMSLYLTETRLWTIFLSISLATPLVFLLLLVTVWESEHALKASHVLKLIRIPYPTKYLGWKWSTYNIFAKISGKIEKLED